MEAEKILNADILDIIFEGKNKSYGAYELRKTYNGRIMKSLIAMGVFLLLIGGGFLLAKAVGGKGDKLETEEVVMAEVKKDEPPPPPVIPPPVVPPPPPQIKQIQFTPPVIKKDNEVKKDEKIEEIKEDAAISEVTVQTENTKQVVQAPVVIEKSEVVAAPAKVVEDDSPFTKVEIEAEFPGGIKGWSAYLQKKLDGFQNEAPPGTYKVIVRFIVSRDGSISDVVAQTNYGFGMEEEAVKTIKAGPKWKPAQQNGNIVNAYRTQPITYVVPDE
jgi:periplasmic protein TonB